MILYVYIDIDQANCNSSFCLYWYIRNMSRMKDLKERKKKTFLTVTPDGVH
jgi:hypothetical protein